MQFERKVKNARRFGNSLQFIPFLFQIVYNWPHLCLPFSQSSVGFFAETTRNFISRSQDGHVQNAQKPRRFFYACANCTNFRVLNTVMPDWAYFLPGFSIFVVLRVQELQERAEEGGFLRYVQGADY